MLLAPDPETSQPQLFVAGFLLVLVGSLLGFLIHNRPPAKLFMGDAGSYFIGFSWPWPRSWPRSAAAPCRDIRSWLRSACWPCRCTI